MVTIRHERPGDVAAREALLDVAYGPERFTKPSQRLRQGRLPADALSLVAVEGRRIVGTVRLWQVSAGGKGPAGAAARPARSRARSAQPRHRFDAGAPRACSDAARLGHGAVLLVGDAPYYGRFGFSSEKTGALWLPGLRAASPARLRIDCGRARRRARPDHRRRPAAGATHRPMRPGPVASLQSLRRVQPDRPP